MFNDGNIELKKRMMDDRLLSEVYSHDNSKVFYEHSTLLSALFSTKSNLYLENFLEMSKEDFMGILVESGILSKDKEEDSGTGEIKRKFNGENIMAAIASVGSFDRNYLAYPDFLECLVRIASFYPFPVEPGQKNMFQAMDAKLQHLIGMLNEKYQAAVAPFIEVMAKREQDMRYQPRTVVDDDIDDEYDDA